MFCFIQTTLFCINYLSNVHLYKQFSHMKITLKVFSSSYPVAKISNPDIILRYQNSSDIWGFSDNPIHFSLRRKITEFHVRNASNKIGHSVNRTKDRTKRLLESQKVIKWSKVWAILIILTESS